MTAARSAGEAVTPGQAATELIAAERLRQIAQEGYTPEHDREHVDHELARAAAMYTLHAIGCKQAASPGYWPWPDWEVKPDAPVRMLVKAGALIAAEIDRLQGTAQAAIAAQQPQPAPESVPWRQGRTQPRNIYARTGGGDWKADLMIGQLDTPAAAAEAVRAHNAALGEQPAPELAAAMAETRELRQLVREICDQLVSQKYPPARVAPWLKRAGLPS